MMTQRLALLRSLTSIGVEQYNLRIVIGSKARSNNPPTDSGQNGSDRIRFTFRRIDRIPEGKDFVTTVRRGARVKTAHLRMMWRYNELGRSRLGVSVGRKFGRAVERNRLKRLAREAFRHSTELRGLGVDVVIVAQDSKVMETPGEIAQGFARILERARPTTDA